MPDDTVPELVVHSAEERWASTHWLASQLRHSIPCLLILDCRAPADFARLHIQNSVNVTLPSILYKRLLRGTLSPSAAIPGKSLREWFLDNWKSSLIVLVPELTTDENDNHSLVSKLLLQRLQDNGCCASLLQGGIEAFQSDYPGLCLLRDLERNERPSHLGPLLSLQSLSIEEPSSSSSNSDSSDLSSPRVSRTQTPEFYEKTNGRRESQFPVKILPHLFLGNAQNAADRATLEKYRINYVLNVTPDLPNTFEADDDFKYLQIPIEDHWSQNLASHFPAAIAFIDEARGRERGVLVHCLAGISRSVTVTVAYLMQTTGQSLEDAYELVKHHKPNIAPNFNFMGQLLDFERQLTAGDASGSSLLSAPIHS